MIDTVLVDATLNFFSVRGPVDVLPPSVRAFDAYTDNDFVGLTAALFFLAGLDQPEGRE